VTITITRYQPLINNRPGKHSLGSGSSHAISIKDFPDKESSPDKVLILLIEKKQPLTLSSRWTEDQGRNTIMMLPKIAYNSFSKVSIQ